ncbi:hypothetical protein PGTUg99_009269 [Puccinia graminis f. sp. tritici]|uniref:OTU domain-containing protein n=1 Tax=Puccinia graminis f. sp. tritici TaxID=56615 RepID=A0A5B0LW77_PUCGR|nr:hypothetical protein PGTUg99_009269 [Puccinia graminis f. sp. tritici]
MHCCPTSIALRIISPADSSLVTGITHRVIDELHRSGRQDQDRYPKTRHSIFALLHISQCTALSSQSIQAARHIGLLLGLGSFEQTWHDVDGLKYKWSYSRKLSDYVKTVVHDSSSRRGQNVWIDQRDGLKHQWTLSPVSNEWIDTALESTITSASTSTGIEGAGGSNCPVSPVRSPEANLSPNETPAQEYATQISSKPPRKADLRDLDSRGLPQYTYTKRLIKGDGNCLYRALSYLANGNDQKTNGEWGGEHALAAAAKVLNKKIILLSLASKDPVFLAYGSAPVDPEAPGLIFLNEHYELLFRKPS